MNEIIEQNTTAVAEVTGNSQAATETFIAPKGKIGRPRTRLTKEAVFLVAADGTMKRRTKGKPAHDSKALVYSIPFDYTGETLPEDSRFVRNAVIKDTRKPKVEVPAVENPVVPTTAEMLPTV